MNKYLFFFLFFVSNTILLYSQTRVDYLATFDEKKIHYGMYLGLNQTDYKFRYRSGMNDPLQYEDDVRNIFVKQEPGFNVGLIVDFRLQKNFNFRVEPGLITNAKTLIFYNINEEERALENTFLHVPFVLKYSADRIRNIRPYVLGGISLDYNFTSNENGGDNTEGQFRMKTANFMYEVGVGIDIYLYFFKFSPSIRGVFAINNELIRDKNSPSPYTDPIGFMGTRGVFLNFAFE